MYKSINKGLQGKQVNGFSTSRRNRNPISPKIIRQGLFSYYDFGDGLSYSGSGTSVSDLSDNGFTSTLVNTPTYSPVNNGVETFNATNTSATSSPTATATSAMTWIAWIYRNGNTASYGTITAGRYPSGDGGTNAAGLGFRASTNQLSYTWSNTVGNFDFVSNLIPPVGQWCQVAAAVDSTGGTIYLNNQSVNNGTTNSSLTYGRVAFGNDPNFTTRGCNSTIGLVLTYTRKLSASEIMQTYEAFRPRFGI